MKTKLSTLLLSSLMATLLVGCGETPAESVNSTPADTSVSTPTTESTYKAIDANTEGELWVMTWSGDGEDHLDIGHNPLPTAEVSALNVGMIQGVAKAFNQRYPNIKINIHTELSEPTSGGTSWTDKIIKFHDTHEGRYPDVFASFNIIDDMNMGLTADLSVFKDDPDYAKFNPDLMNLINYYGFQAGLPQYAIPWGIYVNRELARENNISAPAIDWDWNEYTNFISAAKTATEEYRFAGCYDASMMMPRGAFIERQLQTVEKGSEYQVNFATDEFIYAINNLPKQSEASAMGVINASDDDAAKAYMSSGGYWGYNYFKDNMLLTYDGDPWMLFESTVEGSVNLVNSDDWDIYPRPAFTNEAGDYVVDNHVGVCLDPMGIYNYANEDGNPELSDAEYNKLNIAWTFSKFWLTDTAAWEARTEEKFTALDTKTGEKYECAAVNDTFPVVVKGEDYDRQMEIWFSTDNHKAYADKTKYKGFNKCVELWSEGNIYGISDKAFPRYYHLDGDSTNYSILEKIDGFGNAELVGVTIDDPAWASTYAALLKSINREVNGWYNQAFSDLKKTLKEYFGWKDSDF